MNKIGSWLLSQNKFSVSENQNSSKKAKVISITSGKGGVGKTSLTMKIAKMLALKNQRVLLIDCDYNLSNTLLKIGMPLNDNFHSLITSRKTFGECLYKDGNFHLLAGCNGSLDIFEKKISFEKIIIDIISTHENEYDFIFLDSPAGIGKENVALNAYSDLRFFVITPDKSSITDSYSLMKILSNKFGIKENHLLINKVSSEKQYKKMIKALSETAEHFLGCRLNVLGKIQKLDVTVDRFDSILFNGENISLQNDFLKIVNRLTEEYGSHASLGLRSATRLADFEQEVQPTC